MSRAGIGDRWGRGRSLLPVGEIDLGLGRPDEARASLARAVRVCVKIGDHEAAETARGLLASLVE